jgi:anthranilate synthase/aminodeoxychorismate synthase-like glutamine amidotransferase
MGRATPLLGVCLGHQCIGAAYGGKVVRAGRLMHGKTSPILHDGRGVFAGLPSPFEATRYHSLLVERASLPACLAVSAETAEGEIMGLRHRSHPVEGVQFHPESVLTRAGKALLRNFVGLSGPGEEGRR